MTIAIIGGTGEEGFALTLRLVRAGESVVIGSRSEERGREAAERAADLLQLGSRAGTQGSVDGTSNDQAAAGADVVFVTVPFAAQAEICRSIREAVRPNAVVCDTTTPLATAVGGRPWQVVRPWAGSAAEQAKAILPDTVRLVAGFHTVGAEPLGDMERPVEGDVLLCGGDPEAKATVGLLVERIPNLRWVDAGPLSMARLIEPLTAVLVSVNRAYGIHGAGVALTGREGWGRPPERPRA
ncbi:MAG TPA: NADPH-dependent F420 reductase [Actinomycetota bacterium]|nr:NADPH-dependent F420 reductase [Actinomycetota bacterium]